MWAGPPPGSSGPWASAPSAPWRKRTRSCCVPGWARRPIFSPLSPTGGTPSPVRRAGAAVPVKSIGNGTTTPRDLTCDGDVRVTLLALAESVGARLRESGFRAGLVELGVRDAGSLRWQLHQRHLSRATDLTRDIWELSFSLFRELHIWPAPIRSLSIRCGELSPAASPVQTDLFGGSGKTGRPPSAGQLH